jgi:hypothetical protein
MITIEEAISRLSKNIENIPSWKCVEIQEILDLLITIKKNYGIDGNKYNLIVSIPEKFAPFMDKMIKSIDAQIAKESEEANNSNLNVEADEN